MSFSQSLAQHVLDGALSQVGAGFWPGVGTGSQRNPKYIRHPNYKYVNRSKPASAAALARAYARQDKLQAALRAAMGSTKPPRVLHRGPRPLHFPVPRPAWASLSAPVSAVAQLPISYSPVVYSAPVSSGSRVYRPRRPRPIAPIPGPAVNLGTHGLSSLPGLPEDRYDTSALKLYNDTIRNLKATMGLDHKAAKEYYRRHLKR
jgi:hypothetical protein